ncbi:MAG: hypothetical protein O7B99_08340 [Planctomycetota bacterium]|nr:hypothetical protein [Planctomycetota bacterium]
MLFLAGGGMTATGFALALAPAYSWTVTKFAQHVMANGVDFGALIAGGFVLVGLGLATRKSRPVAFAAPAPATAEDSNDSFLIEQVAEDVAHVRNAVAELAQQVTALSEETADTSKGQQQSALFRLAASLDQLDANFDGRLKAQVQALSARFDGFEGLLEAVRSEVGSLQQAAPALATAPEPEALSALAESGSEDEMQVGVDAEPGSFEDSPVLDFFDEVEGLSEQVADPYAQDPLPPLPSQDPGLSEEPSSWESSLEKLLPDDDVGQGPAAP